MAGKKISQLNAAAFLTGSELLPIVQNGETVKSTAFDIANTNFGTFFIPETIYFGGTTCANIVISIGDYYPIELFSTKIEAPNLTTVIGSISLYGDYGGGNHLTEISFPQLSTVGSNIRIIYWDTLNTISINSITSINGYIDLSSNALSQTTIDNILARLVAINYSNQDVILGGGTSAAPSVTGQGYVATLTANGCSVSTN